MAIRSFTGLFLMAIHNELAARIHAFGERYSVLNKPFAWRFTRQDLEQRLNNPSLDLKPALALPPAA